MALEAFAPGVQLKKQDVDAMSLSRSLQRSTHGEKRPSPKRNLILGRFCKKFRIRMMAHTPTGLVNGLVDVRSQQ